MTTRTKIVSVWYDETSDETAWIVDTDTLDGGESNTRYICRTERKAMAAGRRLAKQLGLPLYTVNSRGNKEAV